MNPFWIVFLLIPFLALAARDISKQRVSLWLIVIAYTVAGWGLVNFARGS